MVDRRRVEIYCDTLDLRQCSQLTLDCNIFQADVYVASKAAERLTMQETVWKILT